MKKSIEQALALSSTLDAPSPMLDAEVLLAHVLGKDRVFLRTWPDDELSANQWHQFHALLARRQEGEPVAHIVGRREFWSLSLAVSDKTLIPRPDTEMVVETILGLDLPQRAKVVDLGTGTGAIALALASERSGWEVLGTDVVAEAVSLAEENAGYNDLERVGFIQSHWFENLAGRYFDLIVSNPFGIGALEFSKLYHTEEVHNVYLSMFLNAGWIGGFGYLAIVLMTIIKKEERELISTNQNFLISALRDVVANSMNRPSDYFAVSMAVLMQHPDQIYQDMYRMYINLENTYVTFVAQARRRDELVKLISKRLKIKRKQQYEKFFVTYFDQMNQEERFIFDQMRAMTSGTLYQGNRNMLTLLENNPSLIRELPKLGDVRKHLSFWLKKYDTIFLVRKDMGLLYVGVEDAVPFPSGIDSQVSAWLKAYQEK